MSSITKVALVGAKGNLGEAVLDAVLNAGFQVTALTRQGSTQTFPSGVTVKQVDYDSIDTLVDALKGQDAVVSTIGSAAIGKQIPLIEASAKVGVKRFITSEFGSNTFSPKVSVLPSYKDKIEVTDAAKKAAAESGLTWTAVVNGPFLDWGLSVGFLVNVKERTVELPDGGDNQFSTTTLPTIGKAVVGILKHPEETKNRPVYIQDTVLTQKKLLELVKKAVGADGWKENVTSLAEQLKASYEEFKKPQPNIFLAVFPGIKTAVYGGPEYETVFPKLDNDLLGIKQLTDAEVEAVVAKSVPK
ncbi:hypothetical protein M426DRAFT_67692 [Hypoxylon sp. CI-4A]|nr:hypothetical protein M426DRAFT_67692 [Hypoxylon sp. CI-4A]